MAKTRKTEKQELDREVERSMQEAEDIQAAIRDSGFFYDEEHYHYAEYLAKQEEEARRVEMDYYHSFDDLFWGDYDEDVDDVDDGDEVDDYYEDYYEDYEYDDDNDNDLDGE